MLYDGSKLPLEKWPLTGGEAAFRWLASAICFRYVPLLPQTNVAMLPYEWLLHVFVDTKQH